MPNIDTPVGPVWISKGIIAYVEIDDEALWQVAQHHAVETQGNMIYVESTIEDLEDSEEPLTNAEQALLQVCKEAQSMGAGDISFYG